MQESCTRKTADESQHRIIAFSDPIRTEAYCNDRNLGMKTCCEDMQLVGSRYIVSNHMNELLALEVFGYRC